MRRPGMCVASPPRLRLELKQGVQYEHSADADVSIELSADAVTELIERVGFHVDNVRQASALGVSVAKSLSAAGLAGDDDLRSQSSVEPSDLVQGSLAVCAKSR